MPVIAELATASLRETESVSLNQLLRRFVSVFFTLGRRRLSEWFDYAL
jgi:hypothetical protein